MDKNTIHERTKRLESDIAALMVEYQQETMLNVQEIDLLPIQEMDGTSQPLITVQVKAR